MNIMLVKATADDVNELDTIQKSAFKGLYEIYHDEKSPFLKGTSEMLTWLSMDNLYYWKIYYGNTLCGGIAYYIRPEGEHYLARVYIDPSFQRKGVAKQAILLCEKEFTNVVKYTLDFPINQTANKNCYESVGYVDTGKREKISDKLTLAIYEKIV